MAPATSGDPCATAMPRVRTGASARPWRRGYRRLIGSSPRSTEIASRSACAAMPPHRETAAREFGEVSGSPGSKLDHGVEHQGEVGDVAGHRAFDGHGIERIGERLRGTRPGVGRSPVTLQNAAGIRRLPP